MNGIKGRNKKTQRGQEGQLQACSFCRQVAAREVLRPQVFGHGKQLLVIEDVPTMVCDNCGETYFTGKTLDELERILGHQSELAVPRSVPVAQYMHSAA
jgi:YgiT-type zinc finger domain-containing protein